MSDYQRFSIMLNEEETITLKEYGRGIIGGLLFSLPLLYTMELWWVGISASDEKLLVFIVFTLVMLLGYNKYAGMRPDSRFGDILKESAEEIGIAFIITFFFLLLIDKINFHMGFEEILGKVIVESMIGAIGISVGTAQLGQEKERDQEKSNANAKEKENQEEQVKEHPSAMQLWILSLCGATLFSAAVAPTEEILQIAIASNHFHLLLMVLINLSLSFVIFYYSDFKNTHALKKEFKEILLHLAIAFVSALLISFILLYFFEFGSCGLCNFDVLLAKTIVLSIPAMIGASAGRLLIK